MALCSLTIAWMLSVFLHSSCRFEAVSDNPRPEMSRTATVSIENQTVLFREGGREANLALVSTGRPPYHSTPRGDFQVLYRLRNPMSSTYMVRMPYWLCILPCGAIGLHQALGIAEARLGEPISRGCIRMGRFTARWAYSWMPTGARVSIF